MDNPSDFLDDFKFMEKDFFLLSGNYSQKVCSISHYSSVYDVVSNHVLSSDLSDDFEDYLLHCDDFESFTYYVITDGKDGGVVFCADGMDIICVEKLSDMLDNLKKWYEESEL